MPARAPPIPLGDGSLALTLPDRVLTLVQVGAVGAALLYSAAWLWLTRRPARRGRKME